MLERDAENEEHPHATSLRNSGIAALLNACSYFKRLDIVAVKLQLHCVSPEDADKQPHSSGRFVPYPMVDTLTNEVRSTDTLIRLIVIWQS